MYDNSNYSAKHFQLSQCVKLAAIIRILLIGMDV